MLDAAKVKNVFLDCLYEKAELNGKVVPDDAIIVECVISDFGFNPKKVKKHRDEIKSFIKELPDKFKDGWSFLNLCTDKNGNQWGEQINSEQLLALGLATKDLKYCLPQEMWSHLPGGVPYVQVVTKETVPNKFD